MILQWIRSHANPSTFYIWGKHPLLTSPWDRQMNPLSSMSWWQANIRRSAVLSGLLSLIKTQNESGRLCAVDSLISAGLFRYLLIACISSRVADFSFKTLVSIYKCKFCNNITGKIGANQGTRSALCLFK